MFRNQILISVGLESGGHVFRWQFFWTPKIHIPQNNQMLKKQRMNAHNLPAFVPQVKLCLATLAPTEY